MDTPKKKSVLKRLRPGAYECKGFLVQFTPWVDEKWDGPRDAYHGWRVYRAGSFIEKRLLIDAFRSRRAAYEFVQMQLRQEN